MRNIIAVAKGEEKADLVLKNANIINVFTNEIVKGDVAIYEGYIVGIGNYEGKEEIDLGGKYLSPSFIDGHGPAISGKELNAYVVSGVGTEHECSTIEEMKERLRLGMYIHIREGTAARNLRELIKGVNKDNLRRCIFCTDGKHPGDLLKDGSIDHNIRIAIEAGIDPIDCIKMASLNAAEAYGLKEKGAIAPGFKADLVVIDNLKDFNIIKVFKDGKLVAEDNKLYLIFLLVIMTL